MAIDPKKPIHWKTAKSDPQGKKILTDLQGNILKGHGRAHTCNLFLEFDRTKAAAARKFIREKIAPRVTSAFQQLTDTDKFHKTCEPAGTFFAFFLAHAGYKALGIAAAQTPSHLPFVNGLKASQTKLEDPPVTAWESLFQNTIHALLLIADGSEIAVSDAMCEIRALIDKEPSIKVLGLERGLQQFNQRGDGVEHFGYIDGRSQPLVLKEDLSKETDEEGGITLWDPTFSPFDIALVDDPGGTKSESFGSFFVFRKLEQNVRGFKEHEEFLADRLGMTGEDAERAGAMIVGRFEDGTPVVMSREPEGFKPIWNNFNYDEDKDGLKCPFQAHIRKTNPRGSGPGGAADERTHLMIRRGITYGKREKPPDAEVESTLEFPTGGVGLLFMAYQQDIARQFEFTQAAWANNPGFPQAGTGLDPVIGQDLPNTAGIKADMVPPQKWTAEWECQPSKDKKEANFFKTPDCGLQSFVTMKGGEYFFAPCLSFLKNLP